MCECGVTVSDLNKELEASRLASVTPTGRSAEGSESHSAGDGGRGMLLEELQLARSERDRAVADNRSLKHSVDSLQRYKEVCVCVCV